MPSADEIAANTVPLADDAGGAGELASTELDTAEPMAAESEAVESQNDASDPEPDPANDPAPEATPDAVPDGAPEATPEVTPEVTPDGALVEAVQGGLTWWPFAVYLGAWIALSGLSAYLLQGASPETPARWMPAYPPLVFGGVGLAAVGPAMSAMVWLVARARRPQEHRRGLLASALTRGALAAFFGALIWILTLYFIEIVSNGGVW